MKVLLKNLLRNFIGKPTIKPLYFYLAKFGLLCQIYWLLTSLFPLYGFGDVFLFFFKLSLLLLITLAGLQLGRQIKVGLPETTEVKDRLLTTGMFAFSRNPIFTLFFIIMLLNLLGNFFNPWVWGISLFTAYAHHLIVLKEEEYLKSRWGADFLNYQKKVKRYGFF